MIRSNSERSLVFHFPIAMRYLLYFVLFLGLTQSAFAQKVDSLEIAKVGVDSLVKTIPAPKGKLKKPLNIVPRYATYKSLALPGLGQAYIRQYWTIPIIYAGFGGLGYAIHWNQVRYKSVLSSWENFIYQRDKQLIATPSVNVVIGDKVYEGVTQESVLRSNTALYRRQRDLSIIGCVVLYAFQLVEANVSAHLKTFDNTDDISLKFKPGVRTDYASTPIGITAVYTFK